MFIFKETEPDKKRALELKDYQYGNPFMHPYCRTIINSATGENIGAFCGFLTHKEEIAKAKTAAPDTLFMCFDSIDQATYEFYYYEIQNRKEYRSVFVALGPLVRMKLEHKDELEEIIVAFYKHIENETGRKIGAMYSLNMYQSKTADEDGYYGIDNDDYPEFAPVAPCEDGDPGLFCRREF